MKIETEDKCHYFVAEVEEDAWPVSDGWCIEDVYGTDAWCEQTFGPSDEWGTDPVSGWRRMRNKYYFTDVEKRTWFIMQWS